VTAAGHTGDAGAARAGLIDDDADVRGAALGASQRLGQLNAGDLLRALDDPEPGVRQRACEEAARWTGPGGDDGVDAGDGVDTGAQVDAGGLVTAALVDRSSDADPAVVEAACFALGERTAPGDSLTAAVIDALAAVAGGHTDPLCREAAVAALGAIGDPGGLQAILAGTRDKPAVRRRAVIALAPFSGPAVDAALARAREDRDWQVRQAAEDLTDPGPPPNEP
jgi:HEAT repeat protein